MTQTTKPEQGVLATIINFDCTVMDGADNAFLKFARRLRDKDKTGRLTRFSGPINKTPQAVDLYGQIGDLGFTDIVPVILVGEPENPADPGTEEAAIANLAALFQNAVKMGARTAMGPTGEPWSPVCKVWGVDDPALLPDEVVTQRIAQSAKVHAAAFRTLPDSADFVLNTEFLFGGEQRTFNRLDRSARLARETNLLLGKKRMRVTLDTAHEYEDRAYGDDELATKFAQFQRLIKEDLIGLLHWSRPRKRNHPKSGVYPQKKHFDALWTAGYRGPIDSELFNYTLDFLLQLLPEFDARDPGWNVADPVTPHIECAAQLDEWYVPYAA